MVKQVKHLDWPPWVGRSPHALREYAYSVGFCSANAPGEKPESRAWGRETAQQAFVTLTVYWPFSTSECSYNLIGTDTIMALIVCWYAGHCSKPLYINSFNVTRRMGPHFFSLALILGTYTHKHTMHMYYTYILCMYILLYSISFPALFSETRTVAVQGVLLRPCPLTVNYEFCAYHTTAFSAI